MLAIFHSPSLIAFHSRFIDMKSALLDHCGLVSEIGAKLNFSCNQFLTP